ncbi:MAG: putative sulfate exporter family transporter [Sphaerobacter sp.]|nr:putative sulfate exporter family transporter [Sphaerobacter sp.]
MADRQDGPRAWPAPGVSPAAIRPPVARLLPGLLLVLLVAGLARAATSVLPRALAEVTVALLLGLVLANTARLPAAAQPGITFAVGRLLRLGVILLGARLSVHDVLRTGLDALVIVLSGMTAVLLFTLGAGRLLRLPPRLCLLIGVGTAVCGNSAIIATAPTIEAEERDVSFAVATITLFGTLAVLLYPLIGHLAHFSDQAFGYWAGAAVNDTSQVIATGFAYSEAAGKTATVVKLTRNTLMGPLLVLIGAVYLHARAGRRPTDRARQSRTRRARTVVPPFVLGFLGMALLNSLGLIPAPVAAAASEGARALVLAALAGVGLSTDLGQLRAVGLRPVYLGLAASLLLSVLTLLLIALLVGV